MTEAEKIEWKISFAREVRDELLNRGPASIRGVLGRKLHTLTLELIDARAEEQKKEEVVAPEGEAHVSA